MGRPESESIIVEGFENPVSLYRKGPVLISHQQERDVAQVFAMSLGEYAGIHSGIARFAKAEVVNVGEFRRKYEQLMSQSFQHLLLVDFRKGLEEVFNWQEAVNKQLTWNDLVFMSLDATGSIVGEGGFVTTANVTPRFTEDGFAENIFSQPRFLTRLPLAIRHEHAHSMEEALARALLSANDIETKDELSFGWTNWVIPTVFKEGFAMSRSAGFAVSEDGKITVTNLPFYAPMYESLEDDWFGFAQFERLLLNNYVFPFPEFDYSDSKRVNSMYAWYELAYLSMVGMRVGLQPDKFVELFSDDPVDYLPEGNDLVNKYPHIFSDGRLAINENELPDIGIVDLFHLSAGRAPAMALSQKGLLDECEKLIFDAYAFYARNAVATHRAASDAELLWKQVQRTGESRSAVSEIYFDYGKTIGDLNRSLLQELLGDVEITNLAKYTKTLRDKFAQFAKKHRLARQYSRSIVPLPIHLHDK